MINKQNKGFMWICLSAVCLVILLFLNFNEVNVIADKIVGTIFSTHIKDVVNIVAILSGVTGILVGVASIRISNLGAVEEYFQQGDAKEQTEARRKIYVLINNGQKIDKNDVDAATVIAFFHFWGLMVKKHYLPIWVFESASGYAVIKLYEGLLGMIGERRQDNPEYAQYFEWLYVKVKKKLNINEQPLKRVRQEKTHNDSSFYTMEEVKELGFARCGKHVLISRKASIYGASNMTLGNNVRIDDYCLLSGQISIGSNVHISAYSCLIGGEYGIEVGDFASISSRCAIYAKSDDYSGKAMTNPTIPVSFRAVYGERVRLKRHCIIGTGTTILPGSILEEGAAIGAMSLVKGKVEPWSIWGGLPCKPIKERLKNPLKMEKEYFSVNKEEN